MLDSGFDGLPCIMGKVIIQLSAQAMPTVNSDNLFALVHHCKMVWLVGPQPSVLLESQ